MAKQPTKDELMAEFFRMLMADGLGQEGYPPDQSHRMGPFRALRAPVYPKESVSKGEGIMNKMCIFA